MKKLVIGVFAVLIIGTALYLLTKSIITPTKYQSIIVLTPKTGLGVTLNGVDEITASKMIHRFDSLKKYDKHPTAESIWFSKTIISDIVNLLHAEIIEQKMEKPNRTDITDGIRVYFACDPSANTLQNTTSILLVSTTNAGPNPDPACPSGSYHHDYYQHSLDSTLFKLGSINGAICSGKSDCDGALLYKFICPACTDDPNCPVLPHNISVSKAKKMVHNFGKNTINTKGEWFDLSMWETLANDPNSNGIRIYFSTNSKCGKNPSKIDTASSLRDAFVITSTKYNKNTGDNDDFFDCETAEFYRNAYIHFYKKTRPLDPSQDNGELCPYNCN